MVRTNTLCLKDNEREPNVPGFPSCLSRHRFAHQTPDASHIGGRFFALVGDSKVAAVLPKIKTGSKSMISRQSPSDDPVQPLEREEGDEKAQVCFIISPIGPADSEVRHRANNVRDFVIKPAVEPLGYQVLRSDDVADPGLIVQQIVNTVVTAELVIADLTDLNPNVLYELAVRHETGRPVITIAESDTKLPFDVNQVRTIFFNHTNLRSADECKQRIQEQLQAIHQPGYQQSNPILLAKQLQEWTQSPNQDLKLSAVLLSAFADMSARLNRLESTLGATQLFPWRISGVNERAVGKAEAAREVLEILNTFSSENDKEQETPDERSSRP